VPGNDERCPVFDNEKKKNTSYPGKALFPLTLQQRESLPLEAMW
jgi:hypothetical protein